MNSEQIQGDSVKKNLYPKETKSNMSGWENGEIAAIKDGKEW